MKTNALIACVFAMTVFGSIEEVESRIIRTGRYNEMIAESDLVVIADCIGVANASEADSDLVPDHSRDYLAVSISAFDVKATLKGSHQYERLEVAHFRFKEDAIVPANPEILASFKTHRNHEYVLFLKKHKDGRYKLIQSLDEVFAVREIVPMHALEHLAQEFRTRYADAPKKQNSYEHPEIAAFAYGLAAGILAAVAGFTVRKWRTKKDNEIAQSPSP